MIKSRDWGYISSSKKDLIYTQYLGNLKVLYLDFLYLQVDIHS